MAKIELKTESNWDFPDRNSGRLIQRQQTESPTGARRWGKWHMVGYVIRDHYGNWRAYATPQEALGEAVATRDHAVAAVEAEVRRKRAAEAAAAEAAEQEEAAAK